MESGVVANTYPIIDIHTHLGDILGITGGDLIFKTGIRPLDLFDPSINTFKQWLDYGFHRGVDLYHRSETKNGTLAALKELWMIWSEQRRMRGNLRKSTARNECKRYDK